MCKKPSNRRDITLDPKASRVGIATCCCLMVASPADDLLTCMLQMALLAAAFAKFETATKDKPSQPAAVGVEQTAAVVAASTAGRRSQQQQQKRGINLPPGKGGSQVKPPAEAACDNAVAAEAGATTGVNGDGVCCYVFACAANCGKIRQSCHQVGVPP